MPRSEYSFRYSSVDNAEKAIERILLSYNFFEFNYNGENVWKRYNDSMGVTAIQYLKIQYDSQNVNISAWIGSEGYSGEMNLNGLMGAIPKKKLKKIIDEIACSV